MRCSAAGCSFEGDTPSVIPAGLQPFCGFHALGKEMETRQLFLRLPCACGRASASFQRTVGGFYARHTEDKCIEKTTQAAADDPTVPAGLSTSPSSSNPASSASQKCACGKRADGTQRGTGTFTEWHTARECIEQTVRVTQG